MTVLAHTKPRQALARRIKNQCLQAIVPEHLRRGMFISSLASFLLRQTSPNRILAEQLVNQLDLACAPSVLFFPMGNNASIWRNLQERIDCAKKIPPNQLRTFVDSVIENMPEWMQYNDTRVIRRDVMETIRATRRHIQTA